MRHFGLIGKSLGHSFSKKFFTAKFQAEEIAADYELIELEEISKVRNEVATRLLAGFNVTIPYKEAILPYLDELTDEARAIGAVNCVVVKEDKLIGHNTDAQGIEATMQWIEPKADTKALVLGSGGASKAVQYVLRKLGLEYDVVSRDKSRGSYTYEELTGDIVAEHKLIINTTPLGMSPNTDSYPIFDYDALTSDHALFDVVYNPAKTEFLRRGEERGARTFGGMLMLQTQAIASWHFWNRK